MKEVIYISKRAVIWCEIQYSNCGGVIGLDYKNAKTISALKRKQKIGNISKKKGMFAQIATRNIKRINERLDL